MPFQSPYAGIENEFDARKFMSNLFETIEPFEREIEASEYELASRKNRDLKSHCGRPREYESLRERAR